MYFNPWVNMSEAGLRSQRRESHSCDATTGKAYLLPLPRHFCQGWHLKRMARMAHVWKDYDRLETGDSSSNLLLCCKEILKIKTSTLNCAWEWICSLYSCRCQTIRPLWPLGPPHSALTAVSNASWVEMTSQSFLGCFYKSCWARTSR